MIIKNYNGRDDLNIIENVQDVRVSSGRFEYPNNAESLSNFSIGPDAGDLVISVPFEYFCTPQHGQSHLNVRVLDYKKIGEEFYRRLLVGNVAYICNDQGKTLEKVLNHDQVPV